jgi:hypothetical protein
MNKNKFVTNLNVNHVVYINLHLSYHLIDSIQNMLSRLNKYPKEK